MLINEKKTKILLINTQAKDFAPRISLNGSEIEVVDELKVLGILMNKRLDFNSHGTS